MARTKHCPELHLPKELVQHIQSFLLREKDAARSSLVAKSWHEARCIRPILEFDFDNFNAIGGFWDYVTTTVQRSVDLKIKVERLSLLLPFLLLTPFNYDALVDKLVVDSLTLQVKMLEFYFNYVRNHLYVLPAQVFANKNLTVLRLRYCKVDNLDSRDVLCRNLTTLDLDDVSIEDKSFQDIIVRSPSIESLTLSGKLTRGLKKIDARDLCNLKTLAVRDTFSDLPGITPSVICGRFHKLNSMVLKDVIVDYSFFANLSSSFPNLEDLTLKRLNYDENIRRSSLIISSRSIKRLCLKHTYVEGMLNMVNFDIPNVKMFKFSGDHVPPVSFTAIYGEWKSEIKLSRFDELMIWSELRDIRRKLGQSKISLLFTVDQDRVVTPGRSFEDDCLLAVEDLIYYDLSTQGCNFFIQCVLSFRPKIVDYVCNFDAFIALPIIVLHEMFTMQKKDSPETTIYGLSFFFFLNDLLEVSVEYLEESLGQWQPLSDAMEIQKYKAHQLRLKLEWESHTTQQTIITFTHNR